MIEISNINVIVDENSNRGFNFAYFFQLTKKLIELLKSSWIFLYSKFDFLGVIIFSLCLFSHFCSFAQRIYATTLPGSDPPVAYEFGCETASGCDFFELDRPNIADGDLSSFAEAVFDESGTAFFGVIFSEISADFVGIPFNNKKVGIKLGFRNNEFNSNVLGELLQSIEIYPVDIFEDKLVDSSNQPIQISFNPGDLASELKFGETTFEIVTEIIQEDFYGIMVVLDNEEGKLTNFTLNVFEFYILDFSCEDYVDYLYTNSINNSGNVTKHPGYLEINPGNGELDVSFLFDSYSFEQDSISIIIEDSDYLSLLPISVTPYSDNSALSLPFYLDQNNSVIKEIGINLFQITFVVETSFNRVKLVFDDNLIIKDFIRKSGGVPIVISPKFAKEENGKFIFWEKTSPIFLEPSMTISPSAVFEWFFDSGLSEEIVNGQIVGDVSFSILSNGTLKIENLPFRDPSDPYIFFVSAFDPVSQCRILKRINFEVEGIVLPVLDFSLKGKILPDNVILLDGSFSTDKAEFFSDILIEKASDSLNFVPKIPSFKPEKFFEFNFEDKEAVLGNNFYRISVYSKILKDKIYSNVINIPIVNDWNDNSITVFPNPFSDYINLKLNQPSVGNISITIYSLDGFVLFNTSLNSNENQLKPVRLDLGFLKNGIYILNVESATLSRTLKIFRK